MGSLSPPEMGSPNGAPLRLCEAPDRRLHRLLDRDAVHRGLRIQGEPTCECGRDLHPRLRPHDVVRLHGPDETTAAGAAGSPPADGSLAVRLLVRRSKRTFLPFHTLLLLVLEPREQPRCGPERTELEDHLSVLSIDGGEQHPPAFVDDLDRLFGPDFL